MPKEVNDKAQCSWILLNSVNVCFRNVEENTALSTSIRLERELLDYDFCDG